jgi:hexosaminidase
MIRTRGLWIILAVGVLTAYAGCQSGPGKPVTVSAGKSAPAATGEKKMNIDPADWLLLPTPRQFEIRGGMDARRFALPETYPGESSGVRLAYAEVRESLPASGAELPVVLSIDAARVAHAEGYELTIAEDGVNVVAHDEAGLFYAAQTLKQLARIAAQRGAMPLCSVVDWPDFPNRGILIDIARCRVPEMKNLFEFVDLMASWKINQFQMYSENAFAYRNHPTVWQDASPMTPTQIRDLDAYCKERFIQLVPNQNSFGHMERWLRLPRYADLAEVPNGNDLCPVDPRSLELLRDMYSDLLPNFSSPYADVDCDETWSLGKGRSKAACDEKGVGRVYLEFLLKIRGLVQEQGKTMQFSADIINNHPELIPELPKDVVALEWGYEAEHPYAAHLQRFKDSGVRFYVLPGTSAWNSLLGRTDNAMANLRNAARNGLDFGSEGFLVTDWGDGGHWQFLPVSYLPFAYSAGLSWCVDRNENIDITRAVDVHVFEDEAGVMGKFAYDIGNAYKKTGLEFGNNTTVFKLIQIDLERPLSEAGLGELKVENLQATIAHIDEALARLDSARMRCDDAELIKAEYRMNAAMAKIACRLGIARVQAGGVPTSKLPKEVRAPLADDFEALIPEYRQLFLQRNRSGGLKESAGIMENIVALLRS